MVNLVLEQKKKGHQVEKERRKKLTPEQSDAELNNLYKSNKVTDRYRLIKETWDYAASGSSRKEYSKEVKRELKAWDKAYKKKKGKEYIEKIKGRIDSLTLQELGYADTEKARLIIRDYWDYNEFW